ncbi:MAG: hypothetical protein V4566_00625, partial [Pseudomonadota bacterium]
MAFQVIHIEPALLPPPDDSYGKKNEPDPLRKIVDADPVSVAGEGSAVAARRQIQALKDARTCDAARPPLPRLR